MKQLAAIFCLAVCCTAVCVPGVAQTNKPAYPQTRSERRANEKIRKAEEKYLRKQKKAADKMYKQSLKKSHLPKHPY